MGLNLLIHSECNINPILRSYAHCILSRLDGLGTKDVEDEDESGYSVFFIGCMFSRILYPQISLRNIKSEQEIKILNPRLGSNLMI